jgi:hypothetical protein
MTSLPYMMTIKLYMLGQMMSSFIDTIVKSELFAQLVGRS